MKSGIEQPCRWLLWRCGIPCFSTQLNHDTRLGNWHVVTVVDGLSIVGNWDLISQSSLLAGAGYWALTRVWDSCTRTLTVIQAHKLWNSDISQVPKRLCLLVRALDEVGAIHYFAALINNKTGGYLTGAPQDVTSKRVLINIQFWVKEALLMFTWPGLGRSPFPEFAPPPLPEGQANTDRLSPTPRRIGYPSRLH